jgi:hypothetical protein
VDVGAEALGDALVAEQHRQHRRGALRPESAEVDPHRRPLAVPGVDRLGQRVGAVELGVAIAAEDQQALAGREAHQVVEQAERGLVGPLQVVDEEEEAARLAEVEEAAGDAVEEAEALLGGGQIRAFGEGADAAFELGREAGELGAGVADGLAQLVVRGGVDPQAEGLDEGQVGGGGLELVAAAGEHRAAGDASVVDQLAGEPGLAGAGLAGDQDHAAAAEGSLGPGAAKGGDLGVAGHHAAADQAAEGGGDAGRGGDGGGLGALGEDRFDFGGGGEAVVGVLGEEAEDGVFEVLGKVGAVGTGRNRRRVQVLGEDGERVVAVEGQAAGGELVQHDAEGVEVGAAVELLAQRLFRRHVVDGAGDAALAGDVDAALADREPEVDELDRGVALAVGVEDIGGLEVAVDEAVLVGVVEGLADVDCDLDRLLEVFGPTLLEARTLEELHDEVGHVLVLADVVDRDHVRVAEGGDRARLAEEALAGVADLAVGAHDLDRHRPLELDVPGAEDDAHSAAADLLVEAVAVGEDVADAAGRQHVEGVGRAVEPDGVRFVDVHGCG